MVTGFPTHVRPNSLDPSFWLQDGEHFRIIHCSSPAAFLIKAFLRSLCIELLLLNIFGQKVHCLANIRHKTRKNKMVDELLEEMGHYTISTYTGTGFRGRKVSPRAFSLRAVTDTLDYGWFRRLVVREIILDLIYEGRLEQIGKDLFKLKDL